MSYRIKELFYTLQGEGQNSGRSAVFCRFSGCNLWSGKESDRFRAICQFCDTDFNGIDGLGGGEFTSPKDLVAEIQKTWLAPRDRIGKPLVVCTGGEPLLQVDTQLIEELHGAGFEIAIETNGTIPVPRGIDWVCVSPKANTRLVVTEGDELKFVFPQETASPEQFAQLNFRHFYLQPMDGPHISRNRQLALDYCLANPQWRLSIQIHKVLGIR